MWACYRRSKEETMRIGDWLCTRVFRRAGKVFTIAAALSLITLLCAATGRAGDLSAQPTDNLSVTNAATNVLPQVAGAPAAAPPAAGAPAIESQAGGAPAVA